MKYRKKPVVIEAIEWASSNLEEILRFTEEVGEISVRLIVRADGPVLEIDTLEGTMTASVGDYIIKGVQGEFYPCKPDIFEATYELAE